MFEIRVTSNIPLTSVEDPREAALRFLDSIGYFGGRYQSGGEKELIESVPFRLFYNCFLENQERVWSVAELATVLSTTKATVYRHLKKLRSLDILEEGLAKNDEDGKGYRLRYGNLSKAWSITEANVEAALANYRRTVEHIQDLMDRR